MMIDCSDQELSGSEDDDDGMSDSLASNDPVEPDEPDNFMTLDQYQSGLRKEALVIKVPQELCIGQSNSFKFLYFKQSFLKSI